MERRFAVHARAQLAALLIASVVSAAPHTTKAKAAFQVGVKAYQKGNYAEASRALERSFKLERDSETLFAWAQTERQLDHCDKAIELYTNLLTFTLPPANREAVNSKLAECRAIIEASKPEPEPAPEPAPKIEAPPPPPPEPPRHHWYKEPVGWTLTGVGVVTAIVGLGYLAAGSDADTQRTLADKTDRAAYLKYGDLADRDGKIGLVATIAGTALIAGGAIWFATHGADKRESSAQVSGWLAPSSGGVALSGRF